MIHRIHVTDLAFQVAAGEHVEGHTFIATGTTYGRFLFNRPVLMEVHGDGDTIIENCQFVDMWRNGAGVDIKPTFAMRWKAKWMVEMALWREIFMWPVDVRAIFLQYVGAPWIVRKIVGRL